jgi:hypothetical protein
MVPVTSSLAVVIEDGHVRPPKLGEHLVELVDGRWVCTLREHAGHPCRKGLVTV